MKQIIDERFLSQLELFSLAIKDNVAGLFGGSHQSKNMEHHVNLLIIENTLKAMIFQKLIGIYMVDLSNFI